MGLYYRSHVNHGELTNDVRITDTVKPNYVGGCIR